MTDARRAALGVAVAVALAALAAPAAFASQSWSDRRIESRMLRQASARVAQGDLVGAEATLRELLRLRPRSSAAVLSLGDVYDRLGRPASVLPLVDAFVAADPAATALWTLKLSVLARVDSASALDATVRRWIEVAPEATDPYLEGARGLGLASGTAAAAALIEEGIEALGQRPALMVELGALHLARGRLDDGARAWARALGSSRRANEDVFERVAGLGEERAFVVDAVLDAVVAAPADRASALAAADLALREGLGERAQALAQARVSRGGPGVPDFLETFALAAEEANRPRSALWARDRLRVLGRDPTSRLEADGRVAELALEIGDTAAALAARERLARSWGAGTPERRSAWVDELRLRVAWSRDTDAFARSLARFRDEHPGDRELDALAAGLAARLLAEGRRADAMDVLEGVDGPGAALERGYLLLEAEAIADGVAALESALADLEPAAATETIELLLTLGERTEPGARLIARMAVAARRDRGRDAVREAESGVEDVPESDRSAILALGARIAAAAGLERDAVRLRRRLVAEFPDALETPEAALLLARALAEGPEGRAEAVAILEALVVARPDHPVAPGARDALERIQARGPSRPRGSGR